MIKLISLIYLIRSIVWGIGFTAAALIVLGVMIWALVTVIFNRANIPAYLWRR